MQAGSSASSKREIKAGRCKDELLTTPVPFIYVFLTNQSRRLIRSVLFSAVVRMMKDAALQQRVFCRELVVARVNGVANEATVAGPCFLAAKQLNGSKHTQEIKSVTKAAGLAITSRIFGYDIGFGSHTVPAQSKAARKLTRP